MKFTPHGYQNEGVDFILEHKAAALFWDMGLGKTERKTERIWKNF